MVKATLAIQRNAVVDTDGLPVDDYWSAACLSDLYFAAGCGETLETRSHAWRAMLTRRRSPRGCWSRSSASATAARPDPNPQPRLEPHDATPDEGDRQDIIESLEEAKRAISGVLPELVIDDDRLSSQRLAETHQKVETALNNIEARIGPTAPPSGTA